MIIMGINLALRWPNLNNIGVFFIILLTATTTLGVILAIFIHPRAWCMVCPIGTITNLIGRNKYQLTIDSGLCVECGMCAKVCPVKIKPYMFKGTHIQVIKDGDCLKCGLCVSACPKKALKLGGR